MAISTAIAFTVNWRHTRIALDTLFSVYVSHPLLPGTGGTANYRRQPLVSRRSRVKRRQANGIGEQRGIDRCGLLEDFENCGMLKTSSLRLIWTTNGYGTQA